MEKGRRRIKTERDNDRERWERDRRRLKREEFKRTNCI